MSSIKQSLMLAVVLLTGCVSYSQNQLPPVQTWPPTANAPLKKPTVYVRTTAMGQVNGGPANPAVGRAATVAQAEIVDGFRQSGRFAQVNTDRVDSDIYAEATLYNDEQFSMASAIITGATFFIIPTTAKNTFTLETVFKDPHGKELGRVRKSESVRSWMQVLLIVAVPFNQDTREIVRALTQSTMEEAVQRGLL